MVHAYESLMRSVKYIERSKGALIDETKGNYIEQDKQIDTQRW
jgi:hypothetical protein